jgi:hypothetical protein
MREARRIAGITLALGVWLALPARAQTSEQPNLIFTISGGYLTGGSLWKIPRQLAFAQLGATGNVWDTVSLGRRLRPGLAATLAATYFRSAHLGYSLEAGFFGIGSESACDSVVPFHPTADQVNQQACRYLQGQNISGDVVGFLGGLVWRFSPRGNQPYVRVAGGLAILGGSYIETAAPVRLSSGAAPVLFILADRDHKSLTWMLSLGAGAMLPLSPGYQLRVEARDIILALPCPTGPATDTGAVALGSQLPFPPVGFKIMHIPTITVGLDVVLERRRGRRY